MSEEIIYELTIGNCVICGQETVHRFMNFNTGDADYVCETWDNSNSLNCKEVWRYRTINQPNSVYGGQSNYEPANTIPDKYAYYPKGNVDMPVDQFNEYQDYLNSPEWKIKADMAKEIACRQCESCGISPRMFNKNSHLQAHHNNYYNLYRETKEDIDVLCRACHKKAHGL
jgi:hypothetical protein